MPLDRRSVTRRARHRLSRSPREVAVLFSRLGPWCHDHRRLVLGVWIGLLVLIGSDRWRSRVGEPRRVQPPERRVAARLRHPRTTSSAAKARADRHDRVPRRARRERSRGAAADGGVLRRGRCDPRRRACREPLRAGRPAAGRACRAPRPGRSRSRTSSCPDKISFTRANEIGKEIQRLAPDIDGVQIELGGQVFAASSHPRPRCSASRSPSSS